MTFASSDSSYHAHMRPLEVQSVSATTESSNTHCTTIHRELGDAERREQEHIAAEKGKQKMLRLLNVLSVWQMTP